MGGARRQAREERLVVVIVMQGDSTEGGAPLRSRAPHAALVKIERRQRPQQQAQGESDDAIGVSSLLQISGSVRATLRAKNMPHPPHRRLQNLLRQRLARSCTAETPPVEFRVGAAAERDNIHS